MAEMAKPGDGRMITEWIVHRYGEMGHTGLAGMPPSMAVWMHGSAEDALHSHGSDACVWKQGYGRSKTIEVT